MPKELHMSYSQLKPLAPVFGLVRKAAEEHVMNEYDGCGPVKDTEAGRRRTRAQYLDFGTRYGSERTRNLILASHPNLQSYSKG